MMIEKASLKDLSEIKNLTETCAVALEENGIYQWNEHYPSRERLENDIRLQDLFVLREKDQIHGIIALSDVMDEEYIPIKWLTLNGNNLYVHRLGVHPSTWGKGNGQKLMDFAENYARTEGYRSVRLDTFSQNPRNHRFYEARGYIKLGDVFFPNQSEHPFHCYEKVLD